MSSISSIIDTAKQLFTKIYNSEPDAIARAPGRAEIIGNHTDYNSGYALSAAINRNTIALIKKRNDRKIRVYSTGYSKSPSEFMLDNMQKGEHGDWLNYIKGVLLEVKKLGEISGMDILIDSDVPSSGGVSSSAAIELALSTAVLSLFEIELGDVQKAQMCQRAENGELIGIPCGFLDQASSSLTKKNHLLFLDFKADGDMPVSQIKQIPIDLSKHEVTFVVIVDRDVKRNLGTSGYPARRAQCERSVPILSSMLQKNLSSLRDVSVLDFESCKAKLDELDEEMRRRVEHIVYENQRVLDSISALEAGEIERFGELLTLAGKSALELYELDAQTPELTKLVVLGREIEGVLGMRNMGGGFSAIALALVKNGKIESFQKSLDKRYGPGLEYLPFEPEDGARVVNGS